MNTKQTVEMLEFFNSLFPNDWNAAGTCTDKCIGAIVCLSSSDTEVDEMDISRSSWKYYKVLQSISNTYK